MIEPKAQLNGWMMKQWALAFAHYREQFRGIDEAVAMQQRYRQEFNGDPPLAPPIQSPEGEYRRQDYHSAAKLYEAVSLRKRGVNKPLH